MANNRKNGNTNFVYDKKTNQVVMKKNVPKKRLVVGIDENVELSIQKREIDKKQINKQKYYQKQMKYKNNQNNKKKIKNNIKQNNFDEVPKKKNNNLNKNNTNREKVKRLHFIGNIQLTSINSPKILKERDELETTLTILKKKDKRINSEGEGTNNSQLIKELSVEKKDNELKSQNIEQVIDEPIKKKSQDEEVKQEVQNTFDNLEPIKDNKKTQERIFKRCALEALIYALIITVINVIVYLLFDYIVLLNLFDNKYANMGITILLSLIINYMVAILVDYGFTCLWIKIKNRRGQNQEGDFGGNSWFKRRKHRENITNKE